MNTPSKRSMERGKEIVFDDGGIACPQETPYSNACEKESPCVCCESAIKKIALAFDKLVEEACEVVDSPDFYIKPRDQRVQAIRLKLKGSPEGDTNRDSSKTASKGGEDGGN